MSEQTSQKRISTLTLVTVTIVLVVMAIWGFNAATAPFSDSGSSGDGLGCAPEEQSVIRVIRRGEVTVSVYNAGKRSGRAQDTLDQLELAGFRPGAVGNAPDGIDVARAEVRTTRENDPAAKLVAAAFGKNTKIVVVDEGYGPGVDVFVGDAFTTLKTSAPTKITLPRPETTCS